MRYVFMPCLNEEMSRTGMNPNVRLIPSRVDQNWNRIQEAMYERKFNSLQ